MKDYLRTAHLAAIRMKKYRAKRSLRRAISVAIARGVDVRAIFADFTNSQRHADQRYASPACSITSPPAD